MPNFILSRFQTREKNRFYFVNLSKPWFTMLVPTASGAKGKKTLTTLKESRAAINSVAKAKGWLAKEELLIVGEVASPTALSQALMWLAAGGRNTVELL